MKLSANGKNLIKRFEGCRLEAYLCPANVWTIGWGHTGGSAYPGNKITQAEADRLFDTDIVRYEEPVRGYTQLNQNQYDALVSFCYNLGPGCVYEVMSSGDVPGQMLLYNKAMVGGSLQVLPGLKRRREAEAELYNTKVVNSKFPLPLKMSEDSMCYGGELKSFKKGDRLTAMGENNYSYIVVIDGVTTFIEKQFVKDLGSAGYPYPSRILLEVTEEPCRAWREEARIYKKDDAITVRDEIADYFWITPDNLSLYIRKNATTNR